MWGILGGVARATREQGVLRYAASLKGRVMAHQVMVIDDNELDLFYAQIMLERFNAGVDVKAFDSARAALHAISSGHLRPQLVLLDINMPGMNGFDFLQAYHDWSCEAGHACAPVVMLTSSPDAPDRDKAFSFAEVRDYIVKPLDADSTQGLKRHLPSSA